MTDFRTHLSTQELQGLQRKSDWLGLRLLAVNWGLVLASFALVIRWPGVASVLCALVVLGGRHLGLGILMHECAHRSLMHTRALNEWVGQWLCAAPAFADLTVYRAYHMAHHVKTGTADDPDLPNYAGYPVTRASLRRKLLRDLSGLTGLRAAATLAALYAHPDPSQVQSGYAYRQKDGAAPRVRGNTRLRHLLWNSRRILIVNALALAGLWALGHPLAYLLWPASWLTTYMVFARIRNAAEHGALPGTQGGDIWSNTRTVYARWWERLTVAPNHVNYHVEHHLVPTVPAYRLAHMHQLLKAKGALQQAQVVHGYGAVLKALVQPR